MRIAILIYILSKSSVALANEKPSWVQELIFGEITSKTYGGQGLIWENTVNNYARTNFPSRTAIIQRLDTRYAGYSQQNCKLESKPKDRISKLGYTTSVCYRYNNATNMLGWHMGWCEERYLRNGEVYVSCEKESRFQPKIGYSPEGYFYSYGRVRQFLEDEPKFSTIFIEQGRCGGIKKEYLTRFKFAGREVYYAPLK